MMQRIPEPELMEDMEQAMAYDAADFSAAHGKRVELFRERCAANLSQAHVIDLGCGSGDVLQRFATAFPETVFTGVDGAAAMLELARRRMEKSGLQSRVDFIEALIPSPAIPARDYKVIMSHSLLHQLHKPEVLWQTIRQLAGKDSFIFVADLRRPDSAATARQLVETLSGNEPEVLKRDFYNSLLAAFTPDEIRAQLNAAGLSALTVEETGDIHVLIYGVAG